MAQTISELERERAKLLEAIETQANQISAKRGSSKNEARPHSLNDWLNAAEEVMPSAGVDTFDDVEISRAARQPGQEAPIKASRAGRQASAAAQTTNRSSKNQSTSPVSNRNRSSFFGVIIMLALLLSVIGLIYIAYITAEKQLTQIMQVQADTNEKLANLEQELAELNKVVVSGGNPGALDDLTSQINKLEQDLNNLASLQRQQANLQKAEIASQDLDKVSNQLETKLALKLEGMLADIAELTAKKPTNKGAATAANTQQTTSKDSTIAEPVAPSLPAEPATPKIEQKVIKLVESKPTADMSWLQQQPSNHHTIQLSASNNQQRLLDFAKDNQIQGAKIIQQKVKGAVTYVLITGSYGERAAANNAAAKLKQTAKVDPWVRQISVLQNRVD